MIDESVLVPNEKRDVKDCVSFERVSEIVVNKEHRSENEQEWKYALKTLAEKQELELAEMRRELERVFEGKKLHSN